MKVEMLKFCFRKIDLFFSYQQPTLFQVFCIIQVHQNHPGMLEDFLALAVFRLHNLQKKTFCISGRMQPETKAEF